jgi:phosphorylcholine metabolism protein LicD
MMMLIQLLKELIPCINGTYWLGDGALLGLVREGKLIEGDNDIDLYILEDTTIDLSDSVLEQQQYYLCNKIYNPNNNKLKLNPWLEYCSIIKLNNHKLNRCEVLQLAKKTYKFECIKPRFTNNHIDIFKLKKEGDIYKTDGKWGNLYFTEDDLKPVINTDLGFPVNIFNNVEQVLERQYGDTWRIPNPNFKYF